MKKAQSLMNNKQYCPFDNQDSYLHYVSAQVKRALCEDIGDGDLTASLVPRQQHTEASIIVREAAVICGIDWAKTCFWQVDEAIQIEWLVNEGDTVSPNQTLCTIKGLARSLLTAERCALNFLQTLSSTATQTKQYAEAIAGSNAVILDTRKTIPTFRLAQKYAVNIGGGQNQRLALYDGILIKENHIAAAGSIQKVLEAAFNLELAHDKTISIQIEVESLAQLKEALQANATSVLLDNFSVAQLTEAVALNKQFKSPALLEASGGITLDTVREIALTGVDRISTGALTKHIQAIDLSMRFTAA